MFGKRSSVVEGLSHIAGRQVEKITELNPMQKRIAEAKAALPEYIQDIREKRNETWKDAVLEWEADQQAYIIEAIRAWDFLIVHVSRKRNAIADETPVRETFSISLAAAKTIEFEPGLAPSESGSITIYTRFNSYSTKCEGPLLIDDRLSHSLDRQRRITIPSDTYYYLHPDSLYLETVEDTVSFAKSAIINFAGAGVKLSVPHGKGKEVFDYLHQVIAQGPGPTPVISFRAPAPTEDAV